MQCPISLLPSKFWILQRGIGRVIEIYYFFHDPIRVLSVESNSKDEYYQCMYDVWRILYKGPLYLPASYFYRPLHLVIGEWRHGPLYWWQIFHSGDVTQPAYGEMLKPPPLLRHRIIIHCWADLSHEDRKSVV